MRRLVNILALLTFLALVGGAGWISLVRWQNEAGVRATADALERLRTALLVAAGKPGAELNEHGWPASIDPAWFPDALPRNALLGDARPWLELAPTEHAVLLDPEIRIATTSELGAFWYNPATGAVRARVPARLSDSAAADLYNRVNGTSVVGVIERDARLLAAMEEFARLKEANDAQARALQIDPMDPRVPLPPPDQRAPAGAARP